MEGELAGRSNPAANIKCDLIDLFDHYTFNVKITVLCKHSVMALLSAAEESVISSGHVTKFRSKLRCSTRKSNLASGIHIT